MIAGILKQNSSVSWNYIQAWIVGLNVENGINENYSLRY